MQLSLEFHETAAGHCPIHQFFDDLKSSDPDDFAVVVASVAKLRNRQYHRPPLSKPLGNDLFHPAHEDHSLSMLRRVAEVLGATDHVALRLQPPQKRLKVAEARKPYNSE